MGASSNLAVDNVDQIVQILDPPANTNMVINEILIALSGLPPISPRHNIANNGSLFRGRTWTTRLLGR